MAYGILRGVSFPVRTLYILCALLALATPACKRKSTVTPILPASQPPQSPASRPAEPARPRAILTIDGVEVSFPPMTLHVTDPGQGAAATLATIPTNDPDDNVLRLDMTMPDADPADLSTAEWHFKTDETERAVTLNAIVLHGGDVELQSADLKVTFSRQGDGWIVGIDGECYLFEGPEALQPKKRVTVSGSTPVVLK
jgi:hypothetical protein